MEHLSRSHCSPHCCTCSHFSAFLLVRVSVLLLLLLLLLLFFFVGLLKYLAAHGYGEAASTLKAEAQAKGETFKELEDRPPNRENLVVIKAMEAFDRGSLSEFLTNWRSALSEVSVCGTRFSLDCLPLHARVGVRLMPTPLLLITGNADHRLDLRAPGVLCPHLLCYCWHPPLCPLQARCKLLSAILRVVFCVLCVCSVCVLSLYKSNTEVSLFAAHCRAMTRLQRWQASDSTLKTAAPSSGQCRQRREIEGRGVKRLTERATHLHTHAHTHTNTWPVLCMCVVCIEQQGGGASALFCNAVHSRAAEPRNVCHALLGAKLPVSVSGDFDDG